MRRRRKEKGGAGSVSFSNRQQTERKRSDSKFKLKIKNKKNLRFFIVISWISCRNKTHINSIPPSPKKIKTKVKKKLRCIYQAKRRTLFFLVLVRVLFREKSINVSFYWAPRPYLSWCFSPASVPWELLSTY